MGIMTSTGKYRTVRTKSQSVNYSISLYMKVGNWMRQFSLNKASRSIFSILFFPSRELKSDEKFFYHNNREIVVLVLIVRERLERK